MKYYFTIQWRILNRQLIEFGMNPVLGYLLFLVTFVLSSAYLFYKTAYAAYLFVLVAISIISRLSEKDRNDFVKSNFQIEQYYSIRLVENILLAVPFFVVLLYYGSVLMAGVLLVSTILLVFINPGQNLHFTIPTPYSKRPFEFSTGFRTSFILYIIAYFIVYQSISVGNPNLGVFGLALTFLIGLSHYFNTESAYFVWIYASTPGQFLLKKVLLALRHASYLSLPVAVALGVVFPDHIFILIGVQCLGYVYLLAIVLAKYSSYPQKMNLPQGMLMGLSLWFPPMLLLTIPVFYRQSSKRLNQILLSAQNV